MHEQFLRTEMVLGQPALERLQSAHVAVFGLGGVGSYAAEILARSGVGELTLVDQDTVSVTNINRQLCALHSTVGQSKAEVTARRCRDISPAPSSTPSAPLRRRHRRTLLRPMTTLPTASIWDLQAGSDPAASLAHPHPVGAGTGSKLTPPAAVTDISQTSGAAGPCHAEGTAQPWHPPPEGGVQPGQPAATAQLRPSPAAAASRQCAMGPPPPVTC
ncbi:MAG: ThiF family adenylyltransferase [Oscillospiraceae bacterium]